MSGRTKRTTTPPEQRDRVYGRASTFLSSWSTQHGGPRYPTQESLEAALMRERALRAWRSHLGQSVRHVAEIGKVEIGFCCHCGEPKEAPCEPFYFC